MPYPQQTAEGALCIGMEVGVGRTEAELGAGERKWEGLEAGVVGEGGL